MAELARIKKERQQEAQEKVLALLLFLSKFSKVKTC